MGKMNNQKTPGSIASLSVTGADRLRHTGWCGATISSKALCGTLLMNPSRVLLENKKAIELNKPLIASATTSTGTRHLNKGGQRCQNMGARGAKRRSLSVGRIPACESQPARQAFRCDQRMGKPTDGLSLVKKTTLRTSSSANQHGMHSQGL